MGWREWLRGYAWSFVQFYCRTLTRMWPAWLFLFLDSTDIWDLFLPDRLDGQLRLSWTGRMIMAAVVLAWAAGDVYHRLRIEVEGQRDAKERRARAMAVANHLGECNVIIGQLGPWISRSDGSLEDLYRDIGLYLREAAGSAAEGVFARNPAPIPMTESAERSGHGIWHRAEGKQAALETVILALQTGAYPDVIVPTPIDLESLHARANKYG